MARTRRTVRRQKSRVIIYVHGKETETQYFRGIRSHFRSPRLVVRFEPISPLRLIEKIGRDRKRDRIGISAPQDTYAAVFDKDEFADFEEAKRVAEKNDIFPAFSTPCFEFWLLMHYGPETASLPCTEFCKRLASIDQKYAENPKHLDTPFYVATLDQACENMAISREQICKAGGSSPNSAVDDLISVILRVISK